MYIQPYIEHSSALVHNHIHYCLPQKILSVNVAQFSKMNEYSLIWAKAVEGLGTI